MDFPHQQVNREEIGHVFEGMQIDDEDPFESTNPLLVVATEEISSMLRKENAYDISDENIDSFDEFSSLGALDEVDTRISASNTFASKFGGEDEFTKSDIAADKSRDSGTLGYLNEIDKFSLLTHDEVISLAKRIKQGDQVALETLIRCNLKLVVNVVKKNYLKKLKSSFMFSDLVQEGNIGLMTAALKFDAENGARFSTYAVFWIRQKISRALAYKSLMISVPCHVNERIYKARRSLESAKKDGSESTVVNELQSIYDNTVSKEIDGRLHMLQGDQDIYSLDISPTNDDSMPSLGETLAGLGESPEHRYEIIQCLELMTKALDAIHNPLSEPLEISHTNPDWSRIEAKNALKAKGRKIFELYSGLNDNLDSLKLNEIGAMPDIGLTRERVRQIYVKVRKIFINELTVLSGGLENLPSPILASLQAEKTASNDQVKTSNASQKRTLR